MPNCFGDGRCIWKGNRGYYHVPERAGYTGSKAYTYYKPFKCPYNCKLVICGMCNLSKMPKWILTIYGKCTHCQKMLYNEKMMSKIFTKYTGHNRIEFYKT